MKESRFFKNNLVLAWARLCRQRWLLAGLALLCLLVPAGAGQAAGFLLSQGVELGGITLAITAPAGDQTPRLLAQYMGEMEDVTQYCKFVAMEEEEAMTALNRGEITAVLALPQNFIQGVMWGDNPDLRLIAAGDRPLESLLLLWVGQSACDILSAFQAGVYAVLELYETNPPPGLTRDQVVLDINWKYINLALDRAGMFQTEEVSAVGTLPAALHYALALLTCFALSAAPVFVPIYSGSWLIFQRRLRCAGRGCEAGWLSGVAAAVPVLMALLIPGVLLAGAGDWLLILAAGMGAALFCALFSSLCCLAAGNAAGCGVMAFGISLASLVLAGGVLPPALLPQTLRRLSWLSPVTWLSRLAAWPMGYPMPVSAWAGLGVTAVGMAALSLALYRRRVDRGEGRL